MSYAGSGEFAGETNATGYADKNFSYSAPCGVVLDHDILRIRKFRHDLEALRFKDVPMPGTLLNLDGLFTQFHHKISQINL